MPAEGVWFWVEGMIDAFFYIDLVLNFFVAYEVRGQRGWGAHVLRSGATKHTQLLQGPQYGCGSLTVHHPSRLVAPVQDPVTGDIIADQRKIAVRYLKVSLQPAWG
jgi:hypothetical protein